MLQKLEKVFGGRFYFLAVCFVVVASMVLRFYKLSEFATFLGDQGRDAIIIKRILTFEHLPTIGPVTSIGQVYLGPFFFYFMSPWLLLFWFQPEGLAYGTAILATISLIGVHLCIKDMLNKEIALITSFFIAFSSLFVEYSRFSWNPNLLPFFAFFTFYFAHKSVQKNYTRYFLLTGSFLSFSLQLHYLALFLIPAVGLTYLIYLWNERKKIKKAVIHIIGSIVAFVVFTSPLLLFDLRHDFLNIKGFLKLTSGTPAVNHNPLADSSFVFKMLNTYLFVSIPQDLILNILLVCIGIFCIISLLKKGVYRTFGIFLICTFFGVTLYNGPKYPHYLAIIYIFYLIAISYLLAQLFHYKVGFVAVILCLIGFVYLNAPRYTFFIDSPSNQITRARVIAKIIYGQVTKSKFTVTMLPERSFDSPYRYFLEVWNKRPLEKDSLVKADELFVVCEKACKPIGDPLWDIAFFAPTKIVSKQVAPGYPDYTVYKLVR